MRTLVGFLSALFFCWATAVSADDYVEFDSRELFSCAEVKPPQQADMKQKVVVIVIPVSANFFGKEESFENLHYEFAFPKSITILDHFPKTQTGTDGAGVNEKQRRERQVTDLNVKFGGEGKVNFSLWGVGVNAGGEAARNKRDLNEVETNVKSFHLPPRDQVVVAGTSNKGQTFYFDLNWFNQVTRAGQSDFAFLAQVPKDWTGDVISLSCTAKRSGQVAGKLLQNVGLYINGDDAARQRVENLVMTARPVQTEVKDSVTNSIGTKLKLIPAGSFLRGATIEENGSKYEKPQRKVTITKPFYLGTHEVTQREYREVMGNNPSHFTDSELLPVEMVSWLDAVRFCNKLSEREGRKPYYKIDGETVTVLGGSGYRLPTEAEWEFACRASQNTENATKHPFGNDDRELSNYAWFANNSGSKTHPVGQKKPNRWGLYDMQGNVFEWCQDWYSDTYYTESPEKDPAGPARGSLRVLRGGSWDGGVALCRSALRGSIGPTYRSSSFGFRLALSPSGVSDPAEQGQGKGAEPSGGGTEGAKAEPRPEMPVR